MCKKKKIIVSLMSEEKRELLLDFNRQFAENFNSQQGTFIQLLVGILVLFTGFAVVLEKTLSGAEIDLRLFPIAGIACIFVLSWLSLLLINQGCAFRKTQAIVTKIRVQVLGGEEERKEIFGEFGTKTDKLPGFYNVTIFGCDMIKTIIMLIVIFLGIDLQSSQDYFIPYNWYYLLVLLTYSSTAIAECVYLDKKLSLKD